MSTIPELLQAALQLHRAGQWEQARAIYQQVLSLDANHPEALNLLGVICRQTGQYAEAIAYLRTAIERDPTQPGYFANLGDVYRGLGQENEAIESYQQALRLQPSDPVMHHHLGVAFEQAGLLDRAVASYQRALQLQPQYVDAMACLGRVLREQGHLAAAEECFRRAVRAQPAAAEAHFDLGNVLQIQDRLDDAIVCYRQAIRLQPDFAAAECNLGNALREVGQLVEALGHLQRVVAQNPDFAAAHGNLGGVLQEMGRLCDATACYQRALELEPDRPEFLLNMGTVVKDLADVQAAIPWYDRALAVKPGYGQALSSRGMALLSLGQFTEGFAGYEYRIGCRQYNTLQFPQPKWDGSPLADGRLLVHCEQGLGDTLMFVRYLPLVRRRVQHLTVAAEPWHMPLLGLSGYGPLVARDGPLPPFDVHAPLMSLPHIFGTQLDSVPADVPYLAVDPPRVERWRAELQKYSGFKIGIAWQGRPGYRGDCLRSMPLERFAPVAQVEDVRLVSLQKGPGSEQVAALAERFELVDLGPLVDNQGGAFLDTAAVMQSLDLVISSDTAIAHLAGALGVPVWVALSKASEWRWMFDREDSPWYPTMRLFRQTELGKWDDVFERMAAELHRRA